MDTLSPIVADEILLTYDSFALDVLKASSAKKGDALQKCRRPLMLCLQSRGIMAQNPAQEAD